jgi:hypothetical protein
LVPEWQTSDRQHPLNGYGVGLVCGKLSGNIEAIDLDLKYDLSGTLFDRYKKRINECCPGLLHKLTVQKTVSNGYHFIYRCPVIEGNRKLANRHTTDRERKETYNLNFASTQSSEKAKKASDNDKVRVLLETRGEGGYIATVPTPGYQLVYGSFETIQTISPDEREILMSCARSFNEVISEYKAPIRHEKKQVKGLSPFEDYNSRADVVSLLESHGWTVSGRKGQKIMLKRPGQTSAAHSGNYDMEKHWFSVFSTSTEFDPETSYLPYAVYAVLECKKDFAEASRRLYEAGYGDKKEDAPKVNNSVPSKINLLDDDFSFIAKPEDYNAYLEAWRSNTFEKGKTTGFPELDKHFLFKNSSLVVVNGMDNVGKSTVIWYLALLSNLLHGWRWIIFSSENSEGSVMRKLIEFYWCESISQMSDIKYRTAKTHIEANFSILKSDDELYNYKDVLLMAKKLMRKGTYKGLMIDPYNALKIEMTKGFNTHEYHYEAISEMKLFTKRNAISIYLNCHVVTNATRTIPGQHTVPAPKKGDTEGGGKFANKADDFLTVHRDVSHPEDWHWTQIHIRKIKETETGGRVSPYDQPVLITAAPYLAGFMTRDHYNPVKEWHKFNPLHQETMDGGENNDHAEVTKVEVDQELLRNHDFLSQGPGIYLDDGTESPF